MNKITTDKAREIIVELEVDDSVRQHCEGVAHRVETICGILKGAKHKINVEQAVAAALLHDIGRTRSHGLDHAKVGAEIIKEKGYNDLAEMVEAHALPQTAELPLETRILIYADTTTGPDGEVIDPMKKLEFLHRLSLEWKNEAERLLAKEAYEVKRRIVSEIDTLIKQAMSQT